MLATQGLFKQWFNSFRCGKYPPVHNLYFKFDCLYMIGEVTRQGGRQPGLVVEPGTAEGEGLVGL